MESQIKIIDSSPQTLLDFYLNFDKNPDGEQHPTTEVMKLSWFKSILKQTDTSFEVNAANLALVDDFILNPLVKQDLGRDISGEDYFNYLVYVTTLRRKIQNQLRFPANEDGRFTLRPQ